MEVKMLLGLLTTTKYNNLNYKPSTNEWLYNKEPIEVERLALHPTSLMTGWMLFAPGVAPDQHWDGVTGKAGKQPSPDHKRGFSIEVETAEQGVMTWSGAGYGQCAALEELFAQISASEGDHPGKVPVVEYTGSEVKKVGKGQTRIPKFEIVDWVDPAFPPWKLQTEASDTPF